MENAEIENLTCMQIRAKGKIRFGPNHKKKKMLIDVFPSSWIYKLFF